MFKDSSAKYYQNKQKKKLQKRARERYQGLSKEEKKRDNMGMNNVKLSLKIKNKGWWSIEKMRKNASLWLIFSTAKDTSKIGRVFV